VRFSPTTKNPLIAFFQGVLVKWLQRNYTDTMTFPWPLHNAKNVLWCAFFIVIRISGEITFGDLMGANFDNAKSAASHRFFSLRLTF
jgi:hypothetical protein